MADTILHNIRILDFTWVLAGPYATRLLADFGAEIIKVQPPMAHDEDDFARGYYNTWNRNKRGITLNLNKPQGILLARQLVAISDAIVENFSPRVMPNWGLDYDNLRKIKPDVIMLSLSTMGNSGPWRDYVGFGPTIHAFSGMTSLTSYPGKPPSGLGFAYADHIAGLTASLALLGALEYRRKTGEGQHIDVSQVESMTALLGEAFAKYALTGKPPEPEGNRSQKASPYGVYPCKGEDHWCAISVSSDEEWIRFKRALGNPKWAESKRFNTLFGRLKSAAALDKLVEEWTQQHTAEDVMALLQREGVASGVVQDARDLANDPHLKARGFFVGREHLEMGKTISDASPIRLSKSPASYDRVAPLHGQDNDYVYGKLLGLSKEEMVEFKRQGVI